MKYSKFKRYIRNNILFYIRSNGIQVVYAKAPQYNIAFIPINEIKVSDFNDFRYFRKVAVDKIYKLVYNRIRWAKSIRDNDIANSGKPYRLIMSSKAFRKPFEN